MTSTIKRKGVVMSEYILKNTELTLKINSLGAELTAITDSDTLQEYLWNANPTYWKRHAPVLFPIVGSLKNQTYRYEGKEYHLPQHGFARDREFDLTSVTDSEIWFTLKENEETLKVYPFSFVLEIGYLLTGRRITVMWKVKNSGNSDMYFSIGGHPAFLCPLHEKESQTDYYILFDRTDPIRYLLINENGLAIQSPDKAPFLLNTDKGYYKITSDLFDKDALIMENHQCHSISLAGPDKKPYVTVQFDAPVFGLWSPAGKKAPFVCIEPWYGRCDGTNSTGNLKEKEWINRLEAGKHFEASYTIDIA